MKVNSEFSLEIALEHVKLSAHFWHYVVFGKSSRVDFLPLRTFQVIWLSAAGNTEDDIGLDISASSDVTFTSSTLRWFTNPFQAREQQMLHFSCI